MDEFEKEYYQNVIRNDTHDPQWTQFEVDLIRCIRDDYPIIYSKTGDMTRHQRAGKIRSAWKQISNKFKELPMTHIKARWRSILDNYLKQKIYADSNSDCNEALVKNKFMEGTLSFLEGELDLFFDHHKTKKTTEDLNPNEEPSDDENNEDKYALDIRDTLHEEVDLDDEITEVKEEVVDTYVENNNEIEKDTTMEEAKYEPKNTWSEEELLNATRLTKEMIDQLILIKTRNYYMTPLSDK